MTSKFRRCFAAAGLAHDFDEWEGLVGGADLFGVEAAQPKRQGHDAARLEGGPARGSFRSASHSVRAVLVEALPQAQGERTTALHSPFSLRTETRSG